jgi:F-type H+-transporting ATPase subunit gamma
MPSLRQIRRRIRTVQNTAKITRAMEMVAVVKMRRAQQAVLAARPYADRMQVILSHLAAMPQEDPERVDALLRQRPVRHIDLIHITPDRGLCGGLPGNLNRRAGQFFLEQSGRVATVSAVAVGRKGRDFMLRYGRDLKAVFMGLGDRPRLLDTTPIARLVIDDFASGKCDAVYLCYSQFVSTAVQRPIVRQLLPVEPAKLPPAQAVGYIYEPDSIYVLAALLPRYVEREIYQAILEAIASEQSARMVAMRNATDNADELVRELTLLSNKVRQETITKELLDIIGGTWTFQQR